MKAPYVRKIKSLDSKSSLYSRHCRIVCGHVIVYFSQNKFFDISAKGILGLRFGSHFKNRVIVSVEPSVYHEILGLVNNVLSGTIRDSIDSYNALVERFNLFVDSYVNC